MSFASSNIRRLIKTHGVAITLNKVTEGAYNPVTGNRASTVTSYETLGYVYDFSYNMVDGDSVRKDDRLLCLDPIMTNLSALPEPDTTDRIVAFGKTMEVVKSSKIMSGNVVMCYTLHLRA